MLSSRWRVFSKTALSMNSCAFRFATSAINNGDAIKIDYPSLRQPCATSTTPGISADSPEYEAFQNIVHSINSSPDPSSRLLLGFTCGVCSKRHYKSVSKIAYNKGLVLIECDGCKNRHLIKDNIGWFKE